MFNTSILLKLSKPLAVFVIFTIAVYGCSKSNVDPAKLLASDIAFSAPIAVLLPRADETQHYFGIIEGRRPVASFLAPWLLPVGGCDTFLSLSDLARMSNYSERFDVRKLILGRWASLKSVQNKGAGFDCTVYKSSVDQISGNLVAELGGPPPNENLQNSIYMPIAKRAGADITWQNEYDTDIPGKGRTKVIAFKCTFRVVVTTKISGLSNGGIGRCEGKWVFDNDTGEWQRDHLSLIDPPFSVTAVPVERDVRVCSLYFRSDTEVLCDKECSAECRNAALALADELRNLDGAIRIYVGYAGIQEQLEKVAGHYNKIAATLVKGQRDQVEKAIGSARDVLRCEQMRATTSSVDLCDLISASSEIQFAEVHLRED